MKKIVENANKIPVFCDVCGSQDFKYTKVLWPELISAWELSGAEVEYINWQQGYHCTKCKNNLRAIALAKAVIESFEFKGTLLSFCDTHSNIQSLEINRAGNLTSFFKALPNHKLVEYPEFDMTNLDIESDCFDLVIHSDTLEHVPNPEIGLSECRRVLRSGGKCIFTVPIIVNRMTRSREGLLPSYHGQSGVEANDQLVRTEFGADVWATVLRAGFSSCEILSLEYPAALALIARK